MSFFKLSSGDQTHSVKTASGNEYTLAFCEFKKKN